MWHMIYDPWHLPPATWQLTCDKRQTGGGLEVRVFWRYFHKGWMSYIINESTTTVFVEQPWMVYMHHTDRQTCTQSVVCISVVCRAQMHTLTADHRPNTLQTTDLVKKGVTEIWYSFKDIPDITNSNLKTEKKE